MNEQPRNNRPVRSIAYFLLAVIAAIVTPSADAISMLLLLLAGIVLFEVAFFAYRRWRSGS